VLLDRRRFAPALDGAKNGRVRPVLADTRCGQVDRPAPRRALAYRYHAAVIEPKLSASRRWMAFRARRSFRARRRRVARMRLGGCCRSETDHRLVLEVRAITALDLEKFSLDEHVEGVAGDERQRDSPCHCRYPRRNGEYEELLAEEKRVGDAADEHEWP
jgi:hypothetical protein